MLEQRLPMEKIMENQAKLKIAGDLANKFIKAINELVPEKNAGVEVVYAAYLTFKATIEAIEDTQIKSQFKMVLVPVDLLLSRLG